MLKKNGLQPLPASGEGPAFGLIRKTLASVIGLWIGATAAFANATVTVNVSNLSGEFSAYVAEISWFPAIYVAANACTNTMLVKGRAQFSMPTLMRWLLIVYASVTAMHTREDIDEALNIIEDTVVRAIGKRI